MVDHSLPYNDSLNFVLASLWLRVMEESKVDGHGGMLPSEAARLVGGIFGVPPVIVLLAIGCDRFQNPERTMKNHKYKDQVPKLIPALTALLNESK